MKYREMNSGMKGEEAEEKRRPKVRSLPTAAIRARSEKSCLNYTKYLSSRSVLHYTFIIHVLQGYVNVLLL
jgi:hypothetical protein